MKIEKDLHKIPYVIRNKILEGLGIEQSTWGIPDTSIKLNLVLNLLSHSPEELKKHTNLVWQKVASEGNVAKKSNSVYYLNGNSREGWIKWHGNALLFGRILKRNETKVETVFNYDYGILPGNFPMKAEELEELEGKKYIKVGTSFNTDEKRNRGDLIAIEFETFNLIENQKKETTEVSAWAPRYIYLDQTLEEVPKEADTIEEVVKKAKANKVLQEKIITKEGETIYESEQVTWESIDDCSSWNEYHKLIEQLNPSIFAIPEDNITELELEQYEPSLEFKEDLKEAKRPLAEYPQNYGILVSHFRGKSVHLDFRRKQDGFLEGETLMNQPEGLITEEVDTIEKGKKWNKVLLEKGKFRPDMNPNKKVVLVGKARQPLTWLNIREVSYPPGSVGATKFEWGTFITMDEGMVYPGVQRPYFKEFFLDMKLFKGRMVERLLGVSPEWEKPPKGPTQWQAWTNMEDQVPYILSKRQRKDKRDYIPADGESAIPPEWQDKIPLKFQWWAEKAMGAEFSKIEKLNLLDKAYNYLIEQGELSGKPLEIKEEILLEKTAKFSLRWHWWMGPKVIRGLPATDSRYELLIDSGKNFLDRWDFSNRFYGDPTKEAETNASRKTLNIKTPNGDEFKKWLNWEGQIPPADAKLKKVKILGIIEE